MDANELTELLSGLGVEQLRVRNDNLMGLCPFHDERNPSWGISLNPPHLYGCFTCGAKGNLAKLIKHLGGPAHLINAVDAYDSDSTSVVLRSRTGYTQPRELDPDELYPFSETLAVRRFMRNRRVKNPTRFGILHHKLDNRALFPWYIGKKLVGLTGRAMDDNWVKTIPYADTQKGSVLYLPGRRMLRKEPLILVEGEIDAIRVYEAGFKNVAALGFGTFTDQQLKMIVHHGVRRVLTFFDGDQTGDRLTESVLAKLKKQGIEGSRITYVAAVDNYGDRKLDPGELTPEDIKRCVYLAVKPSASWPLF